jgi:putative ABC transport system permease protein
MALLSRVVAGICALARKKRNERDLDDELRDYLNTAVEQKVAAGMTRSEARRAVRVEIGSVEAVKDYVRDVTWETRVDTFVRDVRFAVRSFLRSPRFTIPALLALALGIGATSAIFSVVRGVMLKPLPYREPDRIVTVWETNRGGAVRNVIASANFVEWRERHRSFEHLGMAGTATVAMIVNGRPDRIRGFTFSSDTFAALGVQPALGRAYTSAEDFDPDNAVIVLSHDFWQTRLGGRQDVLGMSLTTDGRPRTVIGVMPPGFTVVGQKASFLIPYGQTIEQLRAVRGRGGSYGIARLRDGVSREQAASDMRAIAAQLEKEAPQRNLYRSVMVLPLQEQMISELRPALFTLVGAVVLLLLVACVNVANLLLARSASRERELGMRMALGAKRGRLVRQMLTESLVLASSGGVAGLMVAALFHRGLLALVGDRIPIPRLDEVALDLPVVAFTMVTALATGIIFGLAPSFVSTSHAGDALRDGGRHGGGRRLRSVLGTLVVAEVALSLVLLAGAGLLMRSFIKLQSIDPGFDAERVLTARIRLPERQYDFAKAGNFFRESLTRVSGLPGVESVAGAPCLPLEGPCIGTRFWRVDRPKPAEGQEPSSDVRPVTAAFFRTLGIPHVAGRDFSSADTAISAPVAIVSESLVKQQFAGENPLGRPLHVNNVAHASGRVDMEWTIVGVVRDIKGSSLEADIRATIYVPEPQIPGRNLTFIVRAATDPMSLANSVTRIVHSMDAEVPVSDVRTLQDVVGGTIARPRVISTLVAVFALVALALAAVGVYGVMAYSVSQRTQEIGVRMALGATTKSVFRLVLGQALRLVAVGVVAGLLAAGALTRVLERLLYQIEPLDPWTFGITALVLLIVATLASYIPARRSMRIAPVEALRTK